MKPRTTTWMLAAILTTAPLVGCLDDGTTVVDEHTDVPVTIEIATDVAAPQEVTFPVSVSEWVTITELEIQITHLGFHGEEAHETDADIHKVTLHAMHGDEAAPHDEATDDHPDTDDHAEHLEDALPLIVGLEDGALELGTWLAEAGDVTIIDVEIGSTTDTPAIRIEGNFVSAATSVTTTTPLEIELDASAEVDLHSEMPMMLDAASHMQIHMDITGLFEGLTFPAPGTDGDIHVDDAATDPGKELVHRLTEGISAGFDVDGDGHVDDDEHHFMMEEHAE